MPNIALTFDDGPNTVITPQVLDILEENGAVGTFFLIAQNITPESAEMVRRAVAMKERFSGMMGPSTKTLEVIRPMEALPPKRCWLPSLVSM